MKVVRPADRAANVGPRLDDLNAKFDQIKKTPIEEAELTPLIAEYQRLLDATPDTTDNSRRRALIKAKMELLQIRADMQKGLRDVKEVEKTSALGTAALAERQAAIAAKPRYTVVGRLSASTVYDGSRLPLMYRVLSVEGFPGRTLAYLTPAPGVDVAGKVGQLVGVIGEGTTDASLGVPVLKPSRLDALAGSGSGPVKPLAPSGQTPAAAPVKPATPAPAPGSATEPVK